MTVLPPWDELPPEIRAYFRKKNVGLDTRFVIPRRRRVSDERLRNDYLAALRTLGKKTAAIRALHEQHGLSERQLYRRLRGYCGD